MLTRDCTEDTARRLTSSLYLENRLACGAADPAMIHGQLAIARALASMMLYFLLPPNTPYKYRVGDGRWHLAVTLGGVGGSSRSSAGTKFHRPRGRACVTQVTPPHPVGELTGHRHYQQLERRTKNKEQRIEKLSIYNSRYSLTSYHLHLSPDPLPFSSLIHKRLTRQ